MIKTVAICLLPTMMFADTRHAEYFHRHDHKLTKVVGSDDAFRRAKLGELHIGPRGIYTEEGFKMMFPHATVTETLTVRQARTKYKK